MADGRRPVKIKEQRVRSRFYSLLHAKARVDVVAQQVLDHDDGIFKAVRGNDIDSVLRNIDEHVECLHIRDSVGAAPVHIAFLFGHYELGKRIISVAKHLATLSYSSFDEKNPSVYEGENVLHIAIIHRQLELAQWLVREVPELVNAETTGEFFEPSTTCYFGGHPLLFAFSSNQIDIALLILDAAERLRHSNSTVDTSIFMCDRHGNNVLHLAVVHNLPHVYDFALQYAMQLLLNDGSGGCRHDSNPDTSTDNEQPSGEDVTAISEPAIVGRETLAAKMQRVLHRTNNNQLADKIELFQFLKTTNDDGYRRMLDFVMQRNKNELTPLSLAAAIGNQSMFEHIINTASSTAWSYGPVRAVNIPLRDLEQPVPRSDPDRGTLSLLRRAIGLLPYPLAPKGRRGHITAIQCLCSVERLSDTIPDKSEAVQQTIAKRLEMLKLLDIQQLLKKKWKYVGKRRFVTRLAAYTVYLVLLNITTLFQHNTYTEGGTASRIVLGIAEFFALAIAAVKFTNECSQMILNFHGYASEAGAGRLDNLCTITASLSLFLSVTMRAADFPQAQDACIAVTLIFSWFYLLFFLLGFRSTGPFVIMILRMIANDIFRFMFVYGAVMIGFAQAVYVVQDARAGLPQLLHRVRMLLVAGFTGEINYDDNYTSGRMNAFTQVLMLAYVIVVMILLVNLLIAMSVECFLLLPGFRIDR